MDEAVEQGAATVQEIEASLARGPVATTTKKLMPGAQHYVLWANLGPRNSLRVQPEKSNSVVWLNKADSTMSELEPKNRTLVLYCASGIRSMKAQQMLLQAGWDTVHDLGSYSTGLSLDLKG